MPSINSSLNIENLEQLKDLVIAFEKNSIQSTLSKKGFLIRNQHKQITLKIVSIGKVKAK